MSIAPHGSEPASMRSSITLHSSRSISVFKTLQSFPNSPGFLLSFPSFLFPPLAWAFLSFLKQYEGFLGFPSIPSFLSFLSFLFLPLVPVPELGCEAQQRLLAWPYIIVVSTLVIETRILDIRRVAPKQPFMPLVGFAHSIPPITSAGGSVIFAFFPLPIAGRDPFLPKTIHIIVPRRRYEFGVKHEVSNG